MSFWLCQGLQEGTACQARCLDVNLDHMTWTDPTSYITDVGQGELFGVWSHGESNNSISSIFKRCFLNAFLVGFVTSGFSLPWPGCNVECLTIADL